MRILFFILLLSVSCKSVAQVNPDSLLKIWENKNEIDTLRINAYGDYIELVYLYTNPDTAIQLSQKLYDFSLQQKKYKGRTMALQLQGISFFMLGKIDTAIEYFEKAIEIQKEFSDFTGLASSYHNLCGVYNMQGLYEKGIEAETRSLEFSRKINNEKSIALSLIGIAKNKHKLGRHFESLIDLKESISILKRLECYDKIVFAYTDIAGCYKDLGEYEIASDFLKQSIEISEKNKLLQNLPDALNDLGLIHLEKGEYSEALQLYKRAFEIYETNNDYRGIGTVSINMGIIYLNLGNDESALSFFEKSVEVTRQMGDVHAEGTGLFNIGSAYANKDDKKALFYFSSAQDIYRRIKNLPGVNKCLNSIGNILIRKGLYFEAIDSLTKSINICKEIGEKLELGKAYLSLSEAYYKLQQNDKSIIKGLASLKIAEELKANSLIGNAARILYHNYRVTNAVDSAYYAISRLIISRNFDVGKNFPLLSENEKEKYFATINNDFELDYDFALREKDKVKEITDRSYNSALMIKGLLLKSSTALRKAILSSEDSVLIKNYGDWIALKRRIAKYYSNGIDTKEMENQADELEKKLVKESNEFSDLNKVQNLTWENVRSELKAGEAAIEFVCFNNQSKHQLDSAIDKTYCALVINKNSEHPEMFRLFNESELIRIIGTFPGNNLSYIDQIYGSKANTKSQLYDLIWKPMESSLKDYTKIYLSPVGLLHKISFSALAKEKEVFLCDLYRIETQSTTGKVAMPDSYLLNNNDSISLFGGINYNSDSTSTVIWNFLDGSLTETKQIHKILLKQKRNVNCYNMSEATEERFKRIASGSNILHIATHGFFYPETNNLLSEKGTESITEKDIVFRGGSSGFGVRTIVRSRNPLMRSGLVFAGANDIWNRESIANQDSLYKEDGVLTAQEVATIDLRNTGLVVLSACETGLGDIKGSEGVYGLQRAFKMAGVKYLLMTLWQVPDKETSEFMTMFYNNFTKTNDVKAAFDKTRLLMRNRYDPYFWAAFVLVE